MYTIHTVSNNPLAVLADPKLKALTPFISSTLSPTFRSLQPGGTAETISVENDRRRVEQVVWGRTRNAKCELNLHSIGIRYMQLNLL